MDIVSDIRETLGAERELTALRLADLIDSFKDLVASAYDANADDEHDPEGTTIAFERSQVDALIRQARAHLVEVDAALGRLDAGTYGWCERCGAGIPAARLEARPIARTCMSCAGG